MDNGRLKKNISWIFAANVIHAAFSFLLSIFVARILSLDDNGILGYAASWITFVSYCTGLGYGGIITKCFAEDEEHAGTYLRSLVSFRLVLACLGVVVLQLIIRTMNPGETLLHRVVLCQSISIFFGELDLFVYWFRYINKARISAIVKLLAFAVSAVWRVVALAVFHSLLGYAIGVAMETILNGSLVFAIYFRYPKGRFAFDFSVGIRALKSSYPFIFSSILLTIYGQADKIMLKNLVDDASVALYTVSLTLAGCIAMLPNSLIEGFRADVMEAKLHDEELFQRRMRQLYAVVFWLCIAYGLFITVFAKWILLVLYGRKYLGAVSSLSLIVWYTAFSYFGSINNLFMVAEGINKWVPVNTFVGAATNIILNFLLIPRWGIVGAALASLLTQFVANFLMMLINPQLRKGFRLMVAGIALQDIGHWELLAKAKKILLRK